MGSALFETDRAQITAAAEAHFALLLYLVLERGRAVPGVELADLLWSGSDARHQHHCLRQSTYVVRQQGTRQQLNSVVLLDTVTLQVVAISARPGSATNCPEMTSLCLKTALV
ncbi:MAG: hypothetical protein ABJD07_14455 [Gemmatimonadaceae bacterium]